MQKSISKNKFQIGEVIHHKRYNYRGVVVGFDPVCTADESWYEKNQTQPNRNQPWYHVLVDGGSHSTYVAEENLELAGDNKPVNHSMLKQFFTSFFQGKYFKNSMN